MNDIVTCLHDSIEYIDITEVADPERRYLVNCRGCGLQGEVFRCGRCGADNIQPKSCICRYDPELRTQ